jgi:hypothetical protein
MILFRMDKENKIIRKVWKREVTKTVNQLLISIPQNEGIVEGDYVEIKKVK